MGGFHAFVLVGAVVALITLFSQNSLSLGYMSNPSDASKTPPKSRKQCGSMAGYQQHVRHGETPCEPCREAMRDYQRRYRAGEIPSRKWSRSRRRAAELELGELIVEATEKPADDLGADPAFLKARGRQLWDEVTGEFDLNASSLTVLAECCRMADRAERMAAALASKKTMWFEVDNIEEADEAGVPVVVNGMIGEARQLTTAIRQGLNSIGVLKTVKRQDTGVFDELKARRMQRMSENVYKEGD